MERNALSKDAEHRVSEPPTTKNPYLNSMSDLIESHVLDPGLPIQFEIEQGRPSVSEGDDGRQDLLTVIGRRKGQLQPRIHHHSIHRRVGVDEGTEQQQELQRRHPGGRGNQDGTVSQE